MKITLTGDDFNRIMRACGPALSKDDARESLQRPGGGLRHGLRWLYAGANALPLPGRAGHRPIKTVRNDCAIEITRDGEKVSISGGTETYTRPEPVGPYICHADICESAQANRKQTTIAFDARMLTKALKSHCGARDAVIFEIYGADQPVVLHSGQACGLVLPMRVNGERKEPQFWRMEDERQ